MRISDWSSDVCSSDLIRSIGFDLPPTEIKRAEMASPRFSFSISATDGKARTGAITMQRGNIRTPAFMPVGTAATVKAMRPEEVQATGADRSEEHTSELQSLMRISYAVCCLKKKN